MSMVKVWVYLGDVIRFGQVEGWPGLRFVSFVDLVVR